nr:MAG TPA: hypothetical protein [Caudoviricetes sp.]
MPSHGGLPESQFHLLFLWMFPRSWQTTHQSHKQPGIRHEINKRKRKKLRFYVCRKMEVS